MITERHSGLRELIRDVDENGVAEKVKAMFNVNDPDPITSIKVFTSPTLQRRVGKKRYKVKRR